MSRPDRHSAWKFVPPLVCGLVATMFTTQVTFLDDTIPAPGVAYRGLPLPFLIWRPIHGQNRQWEVRWQRGAFDILLWAGAAYIVLQAFSRPLAGRPGHCPICGYDLSGNVSGTCSECGTAVR